MYTIREGLVGQGYGGVPKTVRTKYKVFSTGFKEVLVVRKGKIQSLSVDMFGDGMELIHLGSKPFMLQGLRPECMMHGAMIYQEYDEQTDVWNTYAYQFPKDQELIDEINQLLPSGSSMTADEKFVHLTTQEHHVPASNLKITLQQNGRRGVLSFLYGLGLIYGNREGEGASYMIRFPFWGSVVAYQSVLEWMQQWCVTKQLMIGWSITDTDQGQRYEVSITDWEVLEQFAHWQGVEGPLPARERSAHYHQQLLDYLKLEHNPGDTMKNVSDGVLKLWKK